MTCPLRRPVTGGSRQVGSPDYKGLVGPVVMLTVDSEEYRVWARYDKATGKIEDLSARKVDGRVVRGR